MVMGKSEFLAHGKIYNKNSQNSDFLWQHRFWKTILFWFLAGFCGLQASSLKQKSNKQTTLRDSVLSAIKTFTHLLHPKLHLLIETSLKTAAGEEKKN